MNSRTFSHGVDYDKSTELNLFNTRELSLLLNDVNYFTNVNAADLRRRLFNSQQNEIASKFNLLSATHLSDNKYLYMDSEGIGMGTYFQKKDFFVKHRYIDLNSVLGLVIKDYSRMLSEQYIYLGEDIDTPLIWN